MSSLMRESTFWAGAPSLPGIRLRFPPVVARDVGCSLGRFVVGADTTSKVAEGQGAGYGGCFGGRVPGVGAGVRRVGAFSAQKEALTAADED